MLKQRFLLFLQLLAAEQNGLTNYLYNSIKNVVFPLATVYLVLQFFSVKSYVRTDYYMYVYVGVFYILFTLSFPERAAAWFRIEKQRGTLETIGISQLGFFGTLNYIFIFHVLFFFIIEVPIFIMVAKFFWSFNICPYFSLPFWFFILLNILLSYGLTLIFVSLVLFFDTPGISSIPRKYTYNILSGVFCPVTLLPTWLKAISYMLPFTYGLILLRKIIANKSDVTLNGFIPFISFVTIVILLGQFFLRKVILVIRKKRSFSRY